jgi:hypothetical protein
MYYQQIDLSANQEAFSFLSALTKTDLQWLPITASPSNKGWSGHTPRSHKSGLYLQSPWQQMETRWSYIGKTRKMAPHQKQERNRRGQIQKPQAPKSPVVKLCVCVCVCVHYLFLQSFTSCWIDNVLKYYTLKKRLKEGEKRLHELSI